MQMAKLKCGEILSYASYASSHVTTFNQYSGGIPQTAQWNLPIRSPVPFWDRFLARIITLNRPNIDE